MLPLPKKAPKILVAGSHADNLGNQCGGWTIEWQGLDGNNLTQGIIFLTSLPLSFRLVPAKLQPCAIIQN